MDRRLVRFGRHGARCISAGSRREQLSLAGNRRSTSTAARSGRPAASVPTRVPRPIPVPAPRPAGGRAQAVADHADAATAGTAPAARGRPPQPRPDPIVPGGIVSTGLRPWIDIELTPDRALLDEQGAAIAFEVTLFNSGSAAARDVIVEARLLNAGASQDIELSEFFAAVRRAGRSDPADRALCAHPAAQRGPRCRAPTSANMRLRGANCSCHWSRSASAIAGRAARAQSAAGFLVGQGGEGKDKLAPFRLDQGRTVVEGAWRAPLRKGHSFLIRDVLRTVRRSKETDRLLAHL